MPVEPAEQRRIMRYLDLHSEPEYADLAFIFGTRLRHPADLAIQLYQRGLVPSITVTGGVNRLTGQIEAHLHRDILLNAGIPPDRIIVEDESTNTLENVLFALPKVAAVLDITTVRSTLVIAKWYHARRAIMTLKRHLPAGIRYLPVTYEPAGITRATWHQSDEGIRHVVGDWQAIADYLARGHLAEIIPEGHAFV
jgi:uncharacterized SAM-binding protein YcdF (DUF218 family)